MNVNGRQEQTTYEEGAKWMPRLYENFIKYQI